MAVRNIFGVEEPVLHKKCREVTKFDERLHTLIDDMRETLTLSGGVGLAAPQVGVLRRVVVVLETNVPEGVEPYMIELVNPVITASSGEQRGSEGCLSLPGEWGIVTRPEEVSVRAQDRDGNTFEVSGKGLTARCFCHELDHLEGVVFTDVCERLLTPEEFEGDFLYDDEETEAADGDE